MASEWENQFVGHFHAMRSLAKKQRRLLPGQERLNQALIDRARQEQFRLDRLAALELVADQFEFERFLG